VVDILVKHTTLKDKALYDRIQWSYMDPNAEMSLRACATSKAWYAKRGAIEKPVVVETIARRQFSRLCAGKTRPRGGEIDVARNSPQPMTKRRRPEAALRTGPGTLAGRYMRQFWQPIFHSADLKPGAPCPSAS